MTVPKKGEKKKKFIKRCISFLYNEEPETLTSKDKKNRQAYAICNSMYDKKKNKKNENILLFNDFINENIKYKYMNKEDEMDLYNIIKPFIIKKISKIKDINIHFYIDNNFYNYHIWDNILMYNNYQNNIYGFVDKIYNKKIYNIPQLRNSLNNLIKKYYKEYNINKLLDDRLINIIEEDPEKYSYIIIDSIWVDNISNYVHKKLDWIKKTKIYNI
jgi:hypothetical protein